MRVSARPFGSLKSDQNPLRGWSRCRRRGGSAVEFALIAPMLLAMVAGILTFGILLGAAHNLRLVTAEAARASIAGVTDAERATIVRDTVTRSLANGAMFRPGSVSVRSARMRPTRTSRS